MRKKLLLGFFFFTMTLVNGQQPQNFIGPRENIHLHLNKTTFLQGERLWFKAYVLDQNTKLPSLATTNLHVGIYDDGGRAIKRKLLYVENGMAQGDFGIDTTLVDTEYTVLAWTNFMRNFKELAPFQQRIKILRDGMEEDAGEVDMKISVFPEGGQMISGTYNNMGILVDNGLGQGVKVDNLELVDGTGKVIRSNIATNFFGMGKVGFLVERGKKYFLRRQRPDGSFVRTGIPEAFEGQLGLNVDNNGKDKVLLTLLASTETFSEKDGEVHTIALYQDDFILLEDIEVNEDEPVLAIERKDLPHGILTTVLFNKDLEPIARRMFFNHREDNGQVKALGIEYCFGKSTDSLQVDFILPKGMQGETNISFSALPGQSIAYQPDHSIVSSFLVRPYIKEYFQDHYYFEDQDRRKRYELDKRLIIEGWGKFDWDSRKQQDVELAFEMETGIRFQGRIEDANLSEENQVSLISELSSAMGFEELDGNKSFNANMQLFEGDSLRVSLISRKGKLREPKAELNFKQDVLKSVEDLKFSLNKTKYRQLEFPEETALAQPLNIDKRVIALDEVVLVEKRNPKKKFQISALAEARLIDDADIRRFPSVSTYLIRLGFLMSGNNGEMEFYVRKPPGFVRVPIYIDGMGAVAGEIIGMPLSRIRFLTYSKDRNGPYIIITSNPDYIPPNQRNKFVKFAIENGYARPQDYFAPNYPDYGSQTFKSYGALDWKANISVGSEIPTSIKIPLKSQNNVQLYVEGVGANGSLFSQSLEIGLKQP